MYSNNEKMQRVLDSSGAPSHVTESYRYNSEIISYSDDESRRASLGVTPEHTLTKEDIEPALVLLTDERKPLLIKNN
jgi:hypothetical protein